MSKRIGRHADALFGEHVSQSIAVQLLQAPVFHGYTASVFIELEQEVKRDAVRHALSSGLLEEEPSASNESAAGKRQVLFHVASSESKTGAAFWLWMAADNLRLAAHNASACAVELIELSHSRGAN